MKSQSGNLESSSGTDAPGTGIDVAVVLLTLDQKDQTLRCLRSFKEVSEPRHKIVVWDNGSQDGTVQAVREFFPDVLTHRHQDNLGVASGRNAAVELISHLQPKYLLFLDNDMEVSPDFLVELIRPLEGHPQTALSAGKIKILGSSDYLYGAAGCYVSFRTGKTGHIGYGEMDKGQHDGRRACLPSGGCMLVEKSVFDELSGFDPIFDPYGPEDLDFGLRAKAAGYHSIFAPDAVVYHEARPGHTFGGGMHSTSYVRNKSKLWFRLMKRHASLLDWTIFCLWGAPIGMSRMLVREARKGNLSAIRGVFSGLFEHLRSGSPEKLP